MKSLTNQLGKIDKYLNRKEIGKLPNDIIIKENLIQLFYGDNIKEIKDKNINNEYISNLTQSIALQINERFDETNTIIKSNLPNSLNRYTAIHKSITADKLHAIVIRIQNYDSIPKLENFTDNKDYIKNIKKSITIGDNVLISGETGSGKTTLMNCITELMPNQRIVTIENSVELHIPKHITSSQQLIMTNNKLTNTTYNDLINASMRLNPKKIIIGEIDTENTLTYLRVINTGHKGVYTTIHANSCVGAISAIGLNLKLKGNDTPTNELKEIITNSINLIIHVENKRIKEILYTNIGI